MNFILPIFQEITYIFIKKKRMALKINMDFCIVSSPFNKGVRYIIFLTKRGHERVDQNAIRDLDYTNVSKFLASFGYIETNPLTFELPSNITVKDIGRDKIKKILEVNGLQYSIALESNIKEEFKMLNQRLGAGDPDIINEAVAQVGAIEHWENDIFDTPPIYQPEVENLQIPQIGEKINLFFYLFLECKFLANGTSVLILNGDFSTRQNEPQRNFIKVVEAEFIRIENSKNNTIQLRCAQSNLIFINKIDVLYSGFFEITRPINIKDNVQSFTSTRRYNYNIMEIKKNINPDAMITIEIEQINHFSAMLSLSNKIKLEKELDEQKKYPVQHIKEEAQELISILNEKMHKHAEADEYEKAADYKKNVMSLNSKLKAINKIRREEITIKEYNKIFSIS